MDQPGPLSFHLKTHRDVGGASTGAPLRVGAPRWGMRLARTQGVLHLDSDLGPHHADALVRELDSDDYFLNPSSTRRITSAWPIDVHLHGILNGSTPSIK